MALPGGWGGVGGVGGGAGGRHAPVGWGTGVANKEPPSPPGPSLPGGRPHRGQLHIEATDAVKQIKPQKTRRTILFATYCLGFLLVTYR